MSVMRTLGTVACGRPCHICRRGSVGQRSAPRKGDVRRPGRCRSRLGAARGGRIRDRPRERPCRRVVPGAFAAGIHIHAVGACSPTFAAAGGHLQPAWPAARPRHPNGRHAGDLPNLVVNTRRDRSPQRDHGPGDVVGGPATLFDTTPQAEGECPDHPCQAGRPGHRRGQWRQRRQDRLCRHRTRLRSAGYRPDRTAHGPVRPSRPGRLPPHEADARRARPLRRAGPVHPSCRSPTDPNTATSIMTDVKRSPVRRWVRERSTARLPASSARG